MTLTVDLSAEELMKIRRGASTAHQRRGCTFHHPVWIRYADGPLAGISHPIEAAEVRSHQIGWCHVRHNGPHVAMYERTAEDARVWRFRGWETPGIR